MEPFILFGLLFHVAPNEIGREIRVKISILKVRELYGSSLGSTDDNRHWKRLRTSWQPYVSPVWQICPNIKVYALQ